MDGNKETNVVLLMSYRDMSAYIPSIWCSHREWMWFKKAWDVLSKYKMTSYRNFVEKGQVTLRAVALAMIYIDFCKITLEEDIGYDELYETFKEKVIDNNVETMGFLYARLSENEDYPGFVSSIDELADAERSFVLEVLQEEMDTSLICLGMYLTAINNNNYLCCSTDDYFDDDYEEDIEPLLNIKNYSTYWTSINENIHELIEQTFDELIVGYEWLNEGAYRITY